MDCSIINTNLEILGKLFPKKVFDLKEIQRLEANYTKNHGLWEGNLNANFNGTQVKYLLICEAPPESGDYFYSNEEVAPLLRSVYRVFYHSVPRNIQANLLSNLAEKGFLLIDTLPYAMNYSNHRFNPEYYNLIDACLKWWLNNLKEINFSEDLKIAFGFNQNALNVMIALSHYNQPHKLQGFCSNNSLTPKLIAQSSAGQPTTRRLKEIFFDKT